MRLNAIYNIVWNRKRVQLEPADRALVQIEIILVDRKKKYIGTGIYLHPGEFDQKTRQIINTPNALRFNKAIWDKISEIREHELKITETGRHMTSTDVDQFLVNGATEISFLDFMDRSIKAMTNADGTISLHKLVLSILKSKGIIQFSDITYANVVSFDNDFRRRGLAQTTIAKRHQVFRHYVLTAIKSGLFDAKKNPYSEFHVSKGKHKIRVRLDDDEIKKLFSTKILDKDIDLARDIYSFEALTGISYKDVLVITWAGNIRKNGDDLWIEGLRKKNGNYYRVYLVPAAVALMEKYRNVKGDFVFPAPPLYTMNRLLKLVAVACKINKKLSSHTGRHTAASMWVRRGVNLSTIRDILGHEHIETTEIYAKLESESIKSELIRASAGGQKTGRIPQ